MPAKKIRSRFPEDTVKTLLDKPWWNLPVKEIRKRAEAGEFDDVGVLTENLTK
ncbi:MAG: hypothetical protein IKX95_01310 [Lachnospiraceae bacterium]|nr:hypothetical protein [Lachnospiraceae bacterium]